MCLLHKLMSQLLTSAGAPSYCASDGPYPKSKAYHYISDHPQMKDLRQELELWSPLEAHIAPPVEPVIEPAGEEDVAASAPRVRRIEVLRSDQDLKRTPAPPNVGRQPLGNNVGWGCEIAAMASMHPLMSHGKLRPPGLNPPPSNLRAGHTLLDSQSTPPSFITLIKPIFIMVHTTSAIAVAVLALKAGSVLAAPSYEYFSDEVAARDFDDYEVEAREFDFDEFDARDFDLEDVDARDYDEFEVEARELIDEFDLQEARELLESFEDVDAREEFDFGDVAEREVVDFVEDIVERAPSSTTTSSATATQTATTTTIVAKPTGKAKKETKTVVVTTHAVPSKCKKPSVFQRIKNLFSKSRKNRAQRRAERRKRRAERRAKRKGAKTSSTSTSSTSTSTSTSTSSTSTTTASATATFGSEWAQVTPPPKKDIPKGVRYTEKKTVGKDKITTISRTVTAAPTPCPTNTKKKDDKKSKRDLGEFEVIFERDYDVDELD